MARLLTNCVAMLIIYFVVAIRFQFGYIFHIYVALGIVLGLSYVIYNKGFSAKDVTPDMLPDAMSQDEKQAFIEDGKLRVPFTSLGGLGEAAAQNIVRERETPFLSIEDLKNRAKLSSAVIDLLKAHGCLTGLQETSQVSFF